jgi:hypothetical protein
VSDIGTDIIPVDGEEGGSTHIIKESGRRAIGSGQDIKTSEQLTSEPHVVSLN